MRDASSRTDPDAGPLHPDRFPPGDADRPGWKDRVTASVNHATSGPSSSTARQPPTHRWMPSACCPLAEPLDEVAERKPFPAAVQHHVFRLPLDGTAPFARRRKSSSAVAETARAEPEPLHARAQRGGGADPGSVNWALRGRAPPDPRTIPVRSPCSKERPVARRGSGYGSLPMTATATSEGSMPSNAW